MSRTSKILFAVSLALNVLLIFFLAGRTLYLLNPDAFFAKQEKEFLATLPSGRAQEIEPRIRAIRERHRGIINSITEGREKLVAIMTAPVFDETAFRSELSKVNSLRDGLFAEISDIIILAVRDLDLESRKRVADHLGRLPPFLPPRKPQSNPAAH